MRLDRLRPRTWLLAGLAVAAAVGWLLALAGVGARARVLPADPALLQPLPQAPAAAAPRLLPLARYDAAVSRPLFANDRRPHPFVLDASADGGEARGGSSFEYILTSVLIAPPLRLAIVQPEGGGDGIRVREGASADEFPEWRLVELAPRSAVFEGPGGRRTLELRTFDGTGGEPPSHAPGAARQPPQPRPVPPSPEDPMATDAAEPAPTQVQNQAEAIRQRIEARRAQMRREALQSTAPARKPVESDP